MRSAVLRKRLRNLVICILGTLPLGFLILPSSAGPDFVNSVEDEDFVYFFFREEAVEAMNCGKVRSRPQIFLPITSLFINSLSSPQIQVSTSCPLSTPPCHLLILLLLRTSTAEWAGCARMTRAVPTPSETSGRLSSSLGSTALSLETIHSTLTRFSP